MTASLAIRPATEQDVPLILAFIRGLAEYEKLAHEVVATEAGLRETLFGDMPRASVLIAEWQGQPAGFALWFYNYSTFLARPGIYLEDLYVEPDYRGRGIGLALLRELATIADREGCSRIDWAVLDWNRSAIDFYRKIGAEGMDEWTTFRLTGAALEKLANRD